MKHTNQLKKLIIAALLSSIGIIIPMFSPLKIIIEPASFTLASHVAIFIGMFISPITGMIVCLGTTLGFFIGGYPLLIVFRAGSHVIFAIVGGLIINKYPNFLKNNIQSLGLSFILAVIHSVFEIIAVLPFYYNNQMLSGTNTNFFYTIFLLVGIGTIIHSMVDYAIAQIVFQKIKPILKTS